MLVHADSLFSMMNFADGDFSIAESFFGHSPCYTSGISSGNDYDWYTGDSSRCQINVDNVTFTASEGAVKCTWEFANQLQINPATGRDLWVAGSGIIGTENGQPCLSTSIVSEGGATPATTSTTCSPCSAAVKPSPPVSRVEWFSLTESVISGTFFLSDGSQCQTRSASGGPGNPAAYMFRPGAQCDDMLETIAFAADFSAGCNLTMSPPVGYALTAMTDAQGGNVCVNYAIASPGDAVKVTTSGPCPPCKGV